MREQITQNSSNDSDLPVIDTRIDWFTFNGILSILLLVTLPLIFFPEEGASWVASVKTFVTQKFGVVYLGMGVAAVIFVVYVAYSDIGNIKAGKPEAAVEFKTHSWAAMLFCAGIGTSILFWGMIEWAYYYQGPPFGLDPGSPDAIRWAAAYGIFHWGPIAWAIYLVPAIPIAYFYHVRNKPILKVSQCLAPLIGEKWASSRWGRLIDVFFVFGMIGGGATTLGLAAPLIAEGLNQLFGLPKNIWAQLVVLLVTTLIFAYSAFKGMQGGIQLLSNVNFYLALAFLAFVLLVGPTAFMLDVGLESLGRSLNHSIEMMTNIGAFKQFTDYGFKPSTFAQDWTVFYWAWWLVFAPTIGLFIARISGGRTIRQIVIGVIFYGSLGCAMYFIILGNYGMFLQLTHQLDVVNILNTESAYAAIFAVLRTLPMSTMAIAVFTVLAVIFTATTFDSTSYILASVVQKEVDGEPHRWVRLFWAFALCFMPAVLMFSGDLTTLQTASIFAGAPLILIMSAMMASTIKATKFDLWFQPDYSRPTIHIEEIPANSPWEEGETSPPPEGSVLHQEAEYEQIRQQQEEEHGSAEEDENSHGEPGEENSGKGNNN